MCRQPLKVHGLTAPFTNATTWNTQPPIEAGLPVSTTSFAHQPYPNGAGTNCPSGWAAVDVTPIAQRWAAGAPNYGIELRADESDVSTGQVFWSGDAGPSVAPFLYLTWDRLPNPPTNVVATANADGTATVNWALATVPPGGSAVDHYLVYAINPDGTYGNDFASSVPPAPAPR